VVNEHAPLSAVDEATITLDYLTRSASPDDKSRSYETIIPLSAQKTRLSDSSTTSTIPTRVSTKSSSRSVVVLQILSSKTPLEREADKARAKAEKLEKKAQEKALQGQREYEALVQARARNMLKVAKEEAKRRKKMDEKARLDRLAESLKTNDTNSNEQRQKQANEWVEDSDGMYGGLSGWGSV
jgi:hypothetical protein